MKKEKPKIETKPKGRVVIEHDSMLVVGDTLEEAIAELAQGFYERGVRESRHE